MVLVSVADGTQLGEHIRQISGVGEAETAWSVCSGGSIGRVGVSDGSHDEPCEDQPRPIGAETGVFYHHSAACDREVGIGRGHTS